MRNKKETERHVFLCEMGIVLCKSNKDAGSDYPKSYTLKQKIMVSRVLARILFMCEQLCEWRVFIDIVDHSSGRNE